MARSERESAYPTLWQLHVLRTAAEAEDWKEATDLLGFNNKHQLLRTIKRLQRKLGIQRGLLNDRDEGPSVPDALIPLIAEVGEIVERWKTVETMAKATERSYYVRMDGYWSHVSGFAAPIITGFKPESSDGRITAQIELVPGFGARREIGGTGMVSALLPPSPRADLVIANDDNEPDPPGITSQRLYHWVIVAALHKNHPLKRHITDGVIDLEDLARYEFAASPRGHRTRDLIDLFQSSQRSFNMRFVCDSPGALISLGHDTEIVPFIASDSTVPMGPWLAGMSKSGIGIPAWWPAVRGRGKVLGGAYRVFWRSDDKPAGLRPILEQLVEELTAASTHLDNRVARWVHMIRMPGVNDE